MQKDNTRHIVIVVPPESTLLDLSGPLDVFQKAIENTDETTEKISFSYQTHVVSITKSKRIDMTAGISINSERCYKDIDFPIDTLMVTGLSHRKGYKFDRDFLEWIKQQSTIVRRICSVCAGAFILAEAGVLANKKATTHWKVCDKLANTYPDIEVNKDAIFVKDGNTYTSAGITSGMDLALALVEEDFGKSFALQIARIMVLFLKRPGNQTQYSAVLESQKVDHQPINEITDYIFNHLDEELTVEKLAEYSLMSPRNFARVFVRELNITPIKYIEQLRIQRACWYLTETHLTIDQIANLCGLKNSINMKRLFIKTFETSPSQYRRSFNSSFN